MIEDPLSTATLSLRPDSASFTTQSKSIPVAPQMVTPPSDQTSKTKKPLPALFTRIITPNELASQPWLPSLTRMINESFNSNHLYHPIGLQRDRLRSDTELSEELGANAFTVVAFAKAVFDGEATEMDQEASNEGSRKIIATASVKPWVDDGLWQKPGTHTSHRENGTDMLDGETEETRPSSINCAGDKEITVVAVQPEYRKRGIVDYLIGICERQILLQHERAQDEDKTSNPEFLIILKVVQEINGLYWIRKGFVPVAEQWCQKGSWDSQRGFVLWAMVRDLPIEG